MAEPIKPFSLDQEYRKKTGITPEDISKLRSWLLTQPHLPADLITDQDLILAFHCCDRSFEVTKQVFDLNLTLKTLFSNFFKDRVYSSRIEKILNLTALRWLDVLSPEGHRIFYGRIINSDVKDFVFSDLIKVCFMLLEILQYQEGTWLGGIVIMDMEGVTIHHLAKLDLQSIQQLLYYVQEAMQWKLHGVHFLNAPSFMDKIMMLIKPFTKKGLLSLLHIHKAGSKEIEKVVPIKCLPKGSGGNWMSLQEIQDESKERIRVNEDFFRAEAKKRVTESLRPGRPKTMSDIFGGVVGSFKKLDID